MSDPVVPEALRTLVTASAAEELAEAYDDQIVYPRRILVDRPDDPRRRFPGRPTPVLVIAHENQGVCSWGVPLGDPDPPVLVGGDVYEEEGDAEGSATTLVYAPDVAAYVAARRWDRACLCREPLLQAQADPLDGAGLAFLRHDFTERPSTTGWPTHTQRRFERDGVRILLWSGVEQCDWWISADDRTALAATATRLLELPFLRESLWSNDNLGDALLRRLRSGS